MSTNRKLAAAKAALEHVKDDMRLGIGTGSTAEEFIRLLAERIRHGLRVRCVGTSKRTEKSCAEHGLQLETLNDVVHLDLTVDGADEINGDLDLIKGGGGALLREKIVAAASDRMIVIADDSKLVDELGQCPLPIEVVEFGLEASRVAIAELAVELGMEVELNLRQAEGADFFTDGDNRIIDASFGRIHHAFALADGLAAIPGIVEHGLFLGMADLAYIGSGQGVREIARRV